MRPQSILMFERLFVLSIVLSAISFAIGYGDFSQQVASDPTMQRLGLGGGFVVGLAVTGYAIYLLLWYLIARRAANWAKWILVLFLVLSLTSLPGALSGQWDLSMLLAVAIYALQVAAVVYLFQPDARAWLGTGRAAEVADPD